MSNVRGSGDAGWLTAQRSRGLCQAEITRRDEPRMDLEYTEATSYVIFNVGDFKFRMHMSLSNIMKQRSRDWVCVCARHVCKVALCVLLQAFMMFFRIQHDQDRFSTLPWKQLFLLFFFFPYLAEKRLNDGGRQNSERCPEVDRTPQR